MVNNKIITANINLFVRCIPTELKAIPKIPHLLFFSAQEFKRRQERNVQYKINVEHKEENFTSVYNMKN